jgi:hypothetical protein
MLLIIPSNRFRRWVRCPEATFIAAEPYIWMREWAVEGGSDESKDKNHHPLGGHVPDFLGI